MSVRTEVLDAQTVSIGQSPSKSGKVRLTINSGQVSVIIEGTPGEILRLVSAQLDVATNAVGRARA